MIFQEQLGCSETVYSVIVLGTVPGMSDDRTRIHDSVCLSDIVTQQLSSH